MMRAAKGTIGRNIVQVDGQPIGGPPTDRVFTASLYGHFLSMKRP